MDPSEFALLSPEQQQALLNGPVIAPPDGIIPNFDNPPNNNSLGLIVNIIASILSTFMVLMRLYAKIFRVRKMRLEDYVGIVALASYGGLLYSGYRYMLAPGLFVHMWDIRLKDLPNALFNVALFEILYGPTIMIIKSAILLDWVHLFTGRGSHGVFYWTCHGTIVINVMFYISSTLIDIWQCSPREKAWNKLIPQGHCVNINAVMLVAAILNFISDLLILLLPQRVIWEINMPRKKKFGISIIFTVGIIAVGCGAGRVYSTVTLIESADTTYHVSSLGLLAIGEVAAGFCIFAIPNINKAFGENAVTRKIWLHLRSLIELSSSEKSDVPVLTSWPRERRKGIKQDYSEIEHSTTAESIGDKMQDHIAVN